jgi:hypothetical protein
MLPSISMGGKSAFEGWSDAYSYVLWGLNRFLCYTLLGGALGVVAVLVAHGLSVLFLFLMAHTVSLGLVNKDAADYLLEFAGVKNWGLYGNGSAPALMFIPRYVVVVVAFVVRVLVFAYAFSYFFTANTIICFLMRKHVDRIEIDEVFVEKPEEAKGPEGAAPAEKEEKAQGPAEPSEEKPAGAGPEREQTSQ